MKSTKPIKGHIQAFFGPIFNFKKLMKFFQKIAKFS